MPLITPYDFQMAGATALIEADGNPLAEFCTGAGKSVVIAQVCRRLDTRTITLAPTRELCEQNEKAMFGVRRPTWASSAPAWDAGNMAPAT
jgi:superfamily II DNA or RNA helicase